MPISFNILFLSNVILLITSKAMPLLFLEHETTIAIFLISVIGIPHGAIDHVLFLKKTSKTKVYFYSFYLTLFIVFAFSWIYYPLICMAIFMIMSAYHFGQSQLEKYEITNLNKKMIGFSWGLFILSLLVIFNFEEIRQMLLINEEFNNFHLLFNYKLFLTITIISFVSFLLTGLLYLNSRLLIQELIYLVLIGFTFYTHSLLLGFALFFIFNHSLTVLKSEYQFLSSFDSDFNLFKFIKALFPFTFISISGVFVLYYLKTVGFIDFGLPFILIMIISSLTFPHLVVMESFYTKK